MFKLNSINKDDLKLLLQWRNSKRIRKNMLNNQIISWKSHCAWFERLQNSKDKEFFLFSIDGKKVGLVSFIDINLENKNCSWGFYIGEKTAPKGSGTLMAYYALNHIFDKYDLYKINSVVFRFNKIGIEFHKNLKFNITGTLTKGQYKDLVLFGLLKTD